MFYWNEYGTCALCGLYRYRRVTSETYDNEPFICGPCEADEDDAVRRQMSAEQAAVRDAEERSHERHRHPAEEP